ncbi:hypothetical protein BDR03DRAFT_964594, partial [Suillus americanus]
MNVNVPMSQSKLTLHRVSDCSQVSPASASTTSFHVLWPTGSRCRVDEPRCES